VGRIYIHLKDLFEEIRIYVLLYLLDFYFVGFDSSIFVFLSQKTSVSDIDCKILRLVSHDCIIDQWNSVRFRQVVHTGLYLESPVHVNVGHRNVAQVDILFGFGQTEGLAVDAEACVFNQLPFKQFGLVLFSRQLNLVDAFGFIGSGTAGGIAGHVFKHSWLLVFNPSSVHLFPNSTRTCHNY